MLIPKQRLYNDAPGCDFHCTVKYSVYDTDDCAFVENKIFSVYDTKEECQNEIDLFNSFSVLQKF